MPLSEPKQIYFLSKWLCPYHGRYSARLAAKLKIGQIVSCPECQSVLEDEGGPFRTIQAVPYVSKPRLPGKSDASRTFSDNAPLKKIGHAWRK